MQVLAMCNNEYSLIAELIFRQLFKTSDWFLYSKQRFLYCFRRILLKPAWMLIPKDGSFRIWNLQLWQYLFRLSHIKAWIGFALHINTPMLVDFKHQLYWNFGITFKNMFCRQKSSFVSTCQKNIESNPSFKHSFPRVLAIIYANFWKFRLKRSMLVVEVFTNAMQQIVLAFAMSNKNQPHFNFNK